MNGKIGMSSGKRHLANDTEIIISIKNRFYSKVMLPNENGCMEWIGCINKLGYGNLIHCGYNTVHRYSYYLHNGEFDKNLHVLHKCDNRKCVAPDHLYLGTHADNMADMMAKGRLNNRSGQNSHNRVLNENDVKEIKTKLANGEKHRIIANEYNVDKTTITAINIGRNWKNIK